MKNDSIACLFYKEKSHQVIVYNALLTKIFVSSVSEKTWGGKIPTFWEACLYAVLGLWRTTSNKSFRIIIWLKTKSLSPGRNYFYIFEICLCCLSAKMVSSLHSSCFACRRSEVQKIMVSPVREAQIAAKWTKRLTQLYTFRVVHNPETTAF